MVANMVSIGTRERGDHLETYDRSAEIVSLEAPAAAELLRKAPTAALLGARRVILPLALAVESWLRYGIARLASCDSEEVLARTSWSEGSCAKAVEAKANVIPATFMLTECIVSNFLNRLEFYR